jgi:hypothetical protein
MVQPNEGQLNGWSYRSDASGAIRAVNPNGESRDFRNWSEFWNVAHGRSTSHGKGGRSFSMVLAIVVALIIGAFAVNQIPKSTKPMEHVPANGTGEGMVTDLGCKGKWSDDKKQAIFNSDYKDKLTTITGKVVKAGDGEVELAVLKSTLTYDLQVKLTDARAAYDLEKDQIITVRFVPTSLGGCILPFRGDEGVITPARGGN